MFGSDGIANGDPVRSVKHGLYDHLEQFLFRLNQLVQSKKELL